MTTFRRYGRSFSVPSTVQIMHELRALSAMRASEDGLPSTASWEEIVAHRKTHPTG